MKRRQVGLLQFRLVQHDHFVPAEHLAFRSKRRGEKGDFIIIGIGRRFTVDHGDADGAGYVGGEVPDIVRSQSVRWQFDPHGVHARTNELRTQVDCDTLLRRDLSNAGGGLIHVGDDDTEFQVLRRLVAEIDNLGTQVRGRADDKLPTSEGQLRHRSIRRVLLA